MARPQIVNAEPEPDGPDLEMEDIRRRFSGAQRDLRLILQTYRADDPRVEAAREQVRHIHGELLELRRQREFAKVAEAVREASSQPRRHR